ncbi:Hypp4766 [Branchiostoma lanceolatum]|uniref:Hypp4766 protein n=1 Tax=Branchiostoma lanceolatum TaxID=7740 RepID=A0A8K0EZS9_BRALA|nr:Hypp4766 [Branchiostoma lanceolatum]
MSRAVRSDFPVRNPGPPAPAGLPSRCTDLGAHLRRARNAVFPHPTTNDTHHGTDSMSTEEETGLPGERRDGAGLGRGFIVTRRRRRGRALRAVFAIQESLMDRG